MFFYLKSHEPIFIARLMYSFSAPSPVDEITSAAVPVNSKNTGV